MRENFLNEYLYLIFWMFILSLRLIKDEKSIDFDMVVGRKFYIISDIISSSTKYEIVFVSFDYAIQLSRIFSLVPPGKFTIFKFWLTLRPSSEIPFTMEFPVNTIFLVSLFCFELELGLEFPLSVSNISSFSVTALFIESVLLLRYY